MIVGVDDCRREVLLIVEVSMCCVEELSVEELSVEVLVSVEVLSVEGLMSERKG